MESVKLKISLKKRLAKFDWVTYSQRLQVASNLNKSRPTIDNYIKGEVRNLEFAEKLIKALSKLEKPKHVRAKKQIDETT